jgi:signal transduction histidine kinase
MKPIPQPFARSQVEQLIAMARIALAGSSLFGIWLDPAEPARYADLTYTLHAVYLTYALALAAIMWRRDSSGHLPIATHLTDVIVASVFQYLTLGPSSPFFTYFVFALFTAALRWGWQATVRTAILVLAMFIAMGISLSRTLGPTEFELNRFVVRASYLVVVTILLVFLGRHEARLREEIRRLARWPVGNPGDWTDGVPQILGHAAGIVGAGRATLLWSESEEPWLYTATWSPSGSAISTHPPDTFDPIVPVALHDCTFISSAQLSSITALKVSRAGSITSWTGLPVHVGLLPHLLGSGLASAPFNTNRLNGRVFFTNLPAISAELMPLVEVVAREVSISLDRLSADRQSRQLAILEDRIQVARDLHDGFLQSLTGIRLALQNMARKARGPGVPPEIASGLLELATTLSAEQGELRKFIEELKPPSTAHAGASLSERLEELRCRMAVEWPATISVSVNPDRLTVSPAFDRAVPLMVHEAIVNALKHAQPSAVSVDVTATDDTLRIVVADNGCGFPFTGRRSGGDLAASNTGPRSLRERVTSLGGQIAVESTLGGSRVELSMPLGGANG